MTLNWPVIGQTKQISYLQKCLKNGKLNQAFLFCGPTNSSNSLVAELLIASLHCSSTGEVPCGRCRNCRQLTKKIHADHYSIGLAKDKLTISIAEIRQLISQLQKKSFYGGFKTAVINQAETMNLAANNALLKILEEPPQKTLLILIVRDLHNLPATVVSRCQIIHFTPVARKLINEQGDKQQQAQIQFWRDLFDQRKTIAEQITLLDKITKTPKPAVLVNQLIASGQIYHRDLLLNQAALSEYAYDPSVVTKRSPRDLKVCLEKLQQAGSQLGRQAQAKLILENLIIN